MTEAPQVNGAAALWSRREAAAKILPLVIAGLLFFLVRRQHGGTVNALKAIAEDGWLLAAFALAVAAIPLWPWAPGRWLRRSWPPERCVVVHHWRAARVSKTGQVEVFLRAINVSPFEVLLHSPEFLPYVDDHPTQHATTTPIRLPLKPNGGDGELRVEATVAAHVWQGSAPPPFAKVYVGGSALVELQPDRATAPVGVIGRTGQGDPVRWEEVA